ncbi:noelin-2-like [Corythoichthys intestinalis]|uniref:noelin-2-like n=1 Tax=Corythoichthys intestinalis TaxID=161448 RepID=UPI0025A4ECE7|nr:noelin-2-like [Corythoichthys intestinalis]XP_061791653.1 noelin-2-like isoform X1 [Nerophis lumbriciformis]
MSVPMLKIGAVLSTMAMVTNWMSQTLPSLVGLNGTAVGVSPDGTHERIVSGLYPGSEEAWQVYSTASDPDGLCVCAVVAPARNLCKRDPRSHQLSLLTLQVQNVSQTMDGVHLRTSRDLRHFRESEPLLRGVDGRLHSYASSPRALTSKSLQELRGQVTQLQPLLSTADQYRSDVQTLVSLRGELQNLSVVLTAIQEEIGAYDYEELQRRVVLLETRLHSCMNKLGCGRLTAVNGPITIRASGSRFGSWMTDAMIPSSDSRVWSMDGFYRGRRVLEYRTMADFTKGQNFVQHLLPHAWAGTGHVVYNGSLYYNKHQSNILVQYHFRSRSVLLQRSLSGAGYNNTFPYSWGGSSDIDLMADETGLWAVYTSIPNAGNIVVSRLCPRSLDVLRTWSTGFPKRSAGEAFMICGVLYVTNSHLAGAKVHFAYNTNTSTYEYTDVPFHNLYSHISMMDYNPRERALYTWNNGHQVLYNVTLFHVIRTDG